MRYKNRFLSTLLCLLLILPACTKQSENSVESRSYKHIQFEDTGKINLRITYRHVRYQEQQRNNQVLGNDLD